MSTFDKRQKGFEDKFALDGELQFKIRARRNKLAGIWAAEKMGLDPEKAANYALAVIDEGLKPAESGNVTAKLVRDLTDAKIAITEKEIEVKLSDCEQQAKKQIIG